MYSKRRMVWLKKKTLKRWSRLGFVLTGYMSFPRCVMPAVKAKGCVCCGVQSLVAFPKLKRQVLSYAPSVNSPKDFTDSTLFYVNQDFSLM